MQTKEDTAIAFNPFANDSFENAVHTITATNGSAIAAGGAGVVLTGVGTVTLDNAGNMTFTPCADYNGTPSFMYTVSSGGVMETATINVTVNAVNDAPVIAVPGPQSTNEDTAKVISGFTISDVDSTSLTTTLSIGNGILNVVTGGGASISGNGSGTVILTGTGAQITAALASITYTPAADFNGVSSLSVATSYGGLTTTKTVAVTVSPVADITNDSIAATEDTNATFNVVTGTGGATADNFESGVHVHAQCQLQRHGRTRLVHLHCDRRRRRDRLS